MSCRISARRALSSGAHLALFMYLLSNDFHSFYGNEYNHSTAHPARLPPLLSFCQIQRPIENVNTRHTRTHTHSLPQCERKVNAQLNLLIRRESEESKKKKNQNQSAHTSISICLACNPRAALPRPQLPLNPRQRCLDATPGNKSTVIKFKSPKQQPTPVDKASNWCRRATKANDE